MALPGNTLASTPTPAAFQAPRDARKRLLEDYERGGVGLGDASQGLEVRIWHAWTDGEDVWIESEGVSPSVLYSGADITEIQITFDQLMRPFLAFVEGGRAKYRWYDSLVEDFVVSELPVDAFNPRCSLDDKRRNQVVTASDIILAYMRGDTLYHRLQRDRFLNEYELASGYSRLLNIGMNVHNRFQFQLRV